MSWQPEELIFNDEYQFNVVVENSGSQFSGNLVLKPDGCDLTISGDLLGDRSENFEIRSVDEIVCRSSQGLFILRGLRSRKKGWRILQCHPVPVYHFEVKYDVSNVIFDRSNFRENLDFMAINIHSPSIAKWVGDTKTQDAIIGEHRDGTLFGRDSGPFIEFKQAISGLGCAAVSYDLTESEGRSEGGFSIGLEFSPVFSILFDVPKSADEVFRVLREIDTLFSLLFGEKIYFHKIKLIPSSGRRSSVSLYSPRAANKFPGGSYPFFPLGLNLRLDQLELPALPTQLFAEYFNLSKGGRSVFGKYIRYRELENPDERFLGFFRLLEKLCFEKASFLPTERLISLLDRCGPFLVRYFDGDKKNVRRVLERFPVWNESKLNTASCITKFLKSIPESLRRRWIYDASDVNSICKLRNDLTHANEAEPESEAIESQAKFIEVLLVIRLLLEIGVSIETATLIAPRLSGHRLIEPVPEPSFTTTEAGT